MSLLPALWPRSRNYFCSDESTVFLDLKHQAQFLALLRQLNTAQQLTVIFVTHDINLAAQNASRIILLDSGKVYAIGMPAEVITAANIKEVYDVEVWIDAKSAQRIAQDDVVDLIGLITR